MHSATDTIDPTTIAIIKTDDSCQSDAAVALNCVEGMQRGFAPPPGAPPPAQPMPLSLRARRPSVPRGSASKVVAPSTEVNLQSTCDEGVNRRSPNQNIITAPLVARELRRASQEASTQNVLLSSQWSRRVGGEQAEIVSSLHGNIAALAALNRREKALNEELKAQILGLTNEIAKAKEAYNEEKAKNEKTSSIRRQKDIDEHDDGFLPDIGQPAVAAAAAAAALQQQTQIEVSYQRKMLLLENRCRDSTENNKKLLQKIQQHEQSNLDAQRRLAAMQDENLRLGTQVEAFTSTVSSQSALIMGLRKTINDLNREQQLVSDLTRKLNRTETELETIKLREKLARDEIDKARATTASEKETLMDKIVEFQRQLQQRDREEGSIEALKLKITVLEQESTTLNEVIVGWKAKTVEADERTHQQEQIANRLIEEKLGLEHEKNQLQVVLDSLRLDSERDKLERLARRCDAEQQAEEVLRAKDEQFQALQMMIRTKDEEIAALMDRKEKEISSLLNQLVQVQSDTDKHEKTVADLRNEINRLNKEIQSLKQLSQDDTVQALQLARQKAASHEALMLVTEEKRVLEEQLRDMQAQLAAEQANHQHEREKRQELMERLDAVTRTVLQLQEENAALTVKLAEAAEVPAVVEPPTAIEDSLTVAEKAQLEDAITQLRDEYDSVQQQFEEIDREYRKLVTKKYKTESFQSQVQLLQYENGELNAKLEQIFKDLSKERQIITSMSQEMRELKTRALDPEIVTKLRKTQEALEKTVSSLVEAETASESAFTCLQCMQPFISPMTLVPCGHTYCSSCLAGLGDAAEPGTITCKQCAAATAHETDGVFPNQTLADLTARFTFRQQTLASMASMCLSLRNSFMGRSSAA